MASSSTATQAAGDYLTLAERRYLERWEQTERQRLAKSDSKSHRDPEISLTDHYDLPKVGPELSCASPALDLDATFFSPLNGSLDLLYSISVCIPFQIPSLSIHVLFCMLKLLISIVFSSKTPASTSAICLRISYYCRS